MATTNIYSQLHNANIGEYVTNSSDIFDDFSNQSQYDFNKSIQGQVDELFLNTSIGGGGLSAVLELQITPECLYVTEDNPVTLECNVLFNGVQNFNNSVKEWSITRLSAEKTGDEEWAVNKSKEFTTNVIDITLSDLNGTAAIFTITALCKDQTKCTNTISLSAFGDSDTRVTFDLNNFMDAILTNSDYVVVADQIIESRASLYVLGKRTTPESLTFDYNGLPDGCATYDSLETMNIKVSVTQGQQIKRNNALIVTAKGTYKVLAIKNLLFLIYMQIATALYISYCLQVIS